VVSSFGSYRKSFQGYASAIIMVLIHFGVLKASKESKFAQFSLKLFHEFSSSFIFRLSSLSPFLSLPGA
jgi:hypothetical protein